MDSALRPRDIQARIRSGESAEEVAAAAGTSVEQIMPYASPVLAERAHVAWNAQKSSLRRGSGPASPGAGRTLGEAVEQFLADHRLHDDDVSWDSWRRPDGRWVLTADIDAQDVRRSAEFVHDVAGRYVVADNDDARVLTGDLGVTSPGAAAPAGPAPRRLTSLAGGHDLPLGDDAIELVRDRQPEPEQDTEPFEVAGGDADWIATGTAAEHVDPDPAEVEGLVDGAAPVEEPTAPAEFVDPADDTEPTEPIREAAVPDQEVPDDEVPDDEVPVPVADPDRVDEVRGSEPEEPELDLGVEPQQAADRKAKRKGRSSVPSWDEIMFGGGPES